MNLVWQGSVHKGQCHEYKTMSRQQNDNKEMDIHQQEFGTRSNQQRYLLALDPMVIPLQHHQLMIHHVMKGKTQYQASREENIKSVDMSTYPSVRPVINFSTRCAAGVVKDALPIPTMNSVIYIKLQVPWMQIAVHR